uniref:Ribosomal RNA-processing protein 7 homolog A-like n=1 Tax=Sinocyclocheilus grahami TaxID=75366 RepID=A0A672NEC9_SINGR
MLYIHYTHTIYTIHTHTLYIHYTHTLYTLYTHTHTHSLCTLYTHYIHTHTHSIYTIHTHTLYTHALHMISLGSDPVLTELFSRFGPVLSVELKERPGASESQKHSAVSRYFTDKHRQCFRVAYIVFKHASGVNAAKRHPENDPLIVSTAERRVRTGIHSECVCSSLIIHDLSCQEAERQSKEAEQQQEDEEGWVKVTKGSRSVKVRPHSETANERTLQKEKKKKERKELLNFYTWQHRNTQKEHIAELRKKFEEDKQRIAVLRAERKFRPY